MNSRKLSSLSILQGNKVFKILLGIVLSLILFSTISLAIPERADAYYRVCTAPPGIGTCVNIKYFPDLCLYIPIPVCPVQGPKFNTKSELADIFRTQEGIRRLVCDSLTSFIPGFFDAEKLCLKASLPDLLKPRPTSSPTPSPTSSPTPAEFSCFGKNLGVPFSCYDKSAGCPTGWESSDKNPNTTCSESKLCCFKSLADQSPIEPTLLPTTPPVEGKITPIPTQIPAPGVGYCGNYERKNIKSIGSPLCTINEATWDKELPNDYCLQKYGGSAQYFFECLSSPPVTTPIPTAEPTSAPLKCDSFGFYDEGCECPTGGGCLSGTLGCYSAADGSGVSYCAPVSPRANWCPILNKSVTNSAFCTADASTPTAAPVPPTTGDIECATGGKTGTVKSYDRPRCGSGAAGDYDLDKARNGEFANEQYYDVYTCKDTADGSTYASEYAVNTNACSESPWTIDQVGAGTPTPAPDYRVQCPSEGGNTCSSNTCDDGFTEKTAGNQICKEFTNDSSSICCIKN